MCARRTRLRQEPPARRPTSAALGQILNTPQNENKALRDEITRLRAALSSA